MSRGSGVTRIVASRWSTTMRAESRVPPVSVTTTQVAPFVTDVTRPAVCTVATAASRVDQVYDPGCTAFEPSRATAVRARVAPIAISVSSRGETVVETIPEPTVALTVRGESFSPVDVTVSDCEIGV